MIVERTFAFARDKRAVAAIEFAFIGPLALLLLAASVEFAIVALVGGSLQTGIAAGARYGITGEGISDGTRVAKIKELVVENAWGLVASEDVTVETLVYDDFSSVGTGEPFTDSNGDGERQAGEPYTDTNGNGSWDDDVGTSGPGGPGDVVLYTVIYSSVLTTSGLDDLIGPIQHRHSVVVRNENW